MHTTLIIILVRILMFSTAKIIQGYQLIKYHTSLIIPKRILFNQTGDAGGCESDIQFIKEIVIERTMYQSEAKAWFFLRAFNFTSTTCKLIRRVSKI